MTNTTTSLSLLRSAAIAAAHLRRMADHEVRMADRHLHTCGPDAAEHALARWDRAMTARHDAEKAEKAAWNALASAD